MQGFSAGGLANNTPLAFIDYWGRALRTIARAKITGARRAEGAR
jgi:hypothetical protein